MPSRPQSLGRLLNFSTNSLNQLCNSLLAEHGLSLQQWVMLSALWRENGMLITALAGYSGTNTPAASRIISRMEASGLVERRQDASDGRTVRVYTTEKAEKMRGLLSFHEDINDCLMQGFSEQERSVLFGLLDRVLENAKGELNTVAAKRDNTDSVLKDL